MKKSNLLKMTAMLELILMILILFYDILIPTLLIICVGFVFMQVRRESLSGLGFKKPDALFQLVSGVLGLAFLWSLVDYGIILPVLNHLTGTKQNLSTFEELKGNTGLLLFLLAAGWILAAVGEELVYRGFLQNRIMSLFPDGKAGLLFAVAVSSVLFGFAHTEQGITGVVITAVDAVFFSVVRYKYKNLWASVLAHGFINTIGIVTFYFTGPVYGLW